MKNTTVNKELRRLRAEKVLQALRAGKVRRGERVAPWQDLAKLRAKFEELQSPAPRSNKWHSWGTLDNGGWSFVESSDEICKLKLVLFEGATASCWEVFDRGADIVVGRTICNESLASATVWGLSASHWPGFEGPRPAQNPSRAPEFQTKP